MRRCLGRARCCPDKRLTETPASSGRFSVTNLSPSRFRPRKSSAAIQFLCQLRPQEIERPSEHVQEPCLRSLRACRFDRRARHKVRTYRNLDEAMHVVEPDRVMC